MSDVNNKNTEQEQLLTEAVNNANQAIIDKNMFLSSISHGVRTPLNEIFGLVSLAKRNTENKIAMQSYLCSIEQSCGQLLDLLDKTLETAWTEAEKESIGERECDLTEILTEVHDHLKALANDKNIQFDIDCDNIVHREVFTDPAKLKQAMSYFAHNAIDYTGDGGKVTISVTEQNPIGGHAVYDFAVADTGVGIDKHFLETIFVPFAREKNTTFSGVHGIGLGLTIAKNIVDKMGGTIDIKSEVGKGSVFTVTLRFRLPQDVLSVPEVTDDMAERVKGKKVLLVEDNELNREIETKIFNAWGFVVDTANDGSIALDKVRNSQPGDYDIILMDIQMPVMGGWQSAKEIRKLEDKRLAEIPIIALSANVFQSDIQTSSECGMNAHLKKPIDIPLLIKTIDELTN